VSAARRSLALASLMVVAVLGVMASPDLLVEPPGLTSRVESRGGTTAPAPLASREAQELLDVGTSADPAPAPEAPLPIEVARRVPVELAQQLAGEPRGAALAVRELIDGMSDDELRSTLAELTNLDARDLDRIRDVHDYSLRLAAIAMNGVITELEPDGEEVPELLFSRDVDARGEPLEVEESFDGAPRDRIYASFPTEGYASDRVLVKWFREGQPRSLVQELLGDDPSMLVFGRYRIDPRDPSSFIWLSRERGWERGRYRVELYDPAEPLRKLAMGRFVISDAN
jgi:hypothetical protein